MAKRLPIATISERVSKNLSKVRRIQVREANASERANNTDTKHKKLTWGMRFLSDFAANTALHGYIHIVQKNSTKYEKIGWVIIVVLAAVTAAVLLLISGNLNMERPTVTVIESTHYPISNVRFPAVTICNMNKISANSALSLAEKMNRPNNLTVEKLSKMFQLVLHFQGFGEASKEDYDELHGILEANGMSVVNLTSVLTPKCSDMLQKCRWKGIDVRCDSLFQTISTGEGICCSFNYYGLDSNNFPPKVAQSMPTKPRRTSSCGYQTGITTVLTAMSYDYHSAVSSSYGIRLLVHDPHDFPDENAETKSISTNTIAFVTIYPETTYSTDDVCNLAAEVRKCYFHYEHKLNHMKRYSYVNCLAECRSEIVYRLCGCVPYNMASNGSYRVCEMNDMMCVRENRSFFAGAQPGLNQTASEADDDELITYRPCDCQLYCQYN